MPANLTHDYLRAEQVYKEAKTVEDKIAALEEMIRTLPKHKGTDHMLADLRRRLSKLRLEATKPKSKKGYNPYHVPKQGGGQVVLLGPPNSGKSSIVAKTTNAQVQVTEYPFATQGPTPAMMRFEDAQIQLVDVPPITRQYLASGLLGLVKSTDAALLVGDLGSEGILEELDDVLQVLEEGRARLFDPEFPPEERETLVAYVPTLMLLNKADLPGSEDVCELIRDIYAGRFKPIPVSCHKGTGLDVLPEQLFRFLKCLRVYCKQPGKAVDRSEPFVLKQGDTILDLAHQIHRDFPEKLKQARVWGSSRFDGQAVQKDYQLADGDVVELHVDL